MNAPSDLKHNQRRMLISRVNRGLVGLALMILLVGGIISYALYTHRQPSDLHQRAYRISVAATVVLAGISLISATSAYWLRRS